ncbi:matrix metalloproteinase-19-like [Periplaneta americana]|uniref:matrix metalloproteinase-19-like n=1 Tax=Periplaneta americana TaxID=6978 RepID=UPI0037E93899
MMSLAFLLRASLALALYVITAEAAPVSKTEAVSYLEQYGYISSEGTNKSSSLTTREAFIKAISEFQEFSGLPITGELDRNTAEAMSLPRCGVKDKLSATERSRSKRYVLQGSRWRVKDLTYRVLKYPRNIHKSTADAEIAKAFKVWADQTGLTFTRKSTGRVHIEIRFDGGRGASDGPGKILARAYFPQHGGDVTFDDAEWWTVSGNQGTNLLQVAAHEFGHSLGLEHSKVNAALMAPFYRYKSPFRLHTDDIRGIQALYGRRRF